MKRIEHILVLLATTLLLCNCLEDGHKRIDFINKSGHRIWCQISEDKVSEITKKPLFHCTNTFTRPLDNDSSLVIEPPTFHLCWEEELGSHDYIELLVLDGEQFEKYFHSPCDVLRQNVPILYTYRLTLSDLEEMNWTVIFR